MSGYTTVAILGATGKLGKQLLAVLESHARAKELIIKVLTRHTSLNHTNSLKEVYPLLNITFFPIDYKSPNVQDELQSILQGVDVLVSTVGDDSGLTSKDVKTTAELPGFKAQEIVARAASQVGVKLFVPAEYGYPTHTLSSDSEIFIIGKKYFLDLLRGTLHLPWVLVYTGSFPKVEPEATVLPTCTVDIPKASPPFETTRFHVASYIVQLILDGDPTETSWGIFRILGLRRDKLAVSGENGKESWILHEG